MQNPTDLNVEQVLNKKRPLHIGLFISIFIVIIVMGSVARFAWNAYHYVETTNAYVTGHIHPISSRISGIITRVWIKDNQTISEGDLIADLDPNDHRIKIQEINAQIIAAKRQLLQANAQIEQSRYQVKEALAQVSQAQAHSTQATEEAKRYEALYHDPLQVVSQSDFEAMNATRDAALSDVLAREQAVKAAKAQVNATISGKDFIQAQISILETQLKDAEQQLAYNRITAPVAGRIGKLSVEVGSRVQPGQPLVAIVQDNVWIVANFKETQLIHIQPGQLVNVKIDALPGHTLIGYVDSFAPASGSQFSLLPPDNATGNFTKIVQRVPVKILLRSGDIKLLEGKLIPGMSALVSINLHPSNVSKTS